MDVEPVRLKVCDGNFITVDPNEIRHFLAEITVHLVIQVPGVALCPSDVQD